MIPRQYKLYIYSFVLLCAVFCIDIASGFEVHSSGGIRLRLPFNGVRRITAYVDHHKPGAYDGNMVAYHGEERLNCPGSGDNWTTQGPYCYDRHRGTDFALILEPVLAAANGTVTLAANQGTTIGNAVHIDHGNGYETRYYHLNNFSVAVNDTVSAGQQIGISGNSGGQPYHLHFGVYHNGLEADPFGWRGDWTDPIPGGPAQCLWSGSQCAEIVIEDESDWFDKYGGGWNWYHKGYSWTMRKVGNAQATDFAYAHWRPNLPRTGIYQIWAFIPAQVNDANSNVKTKKARYTVSHLYGAQNVVINQSAYADQWVLLGN